MSFGTVMLLVAGFFVAAVAVMLWLALRDEDFGGNRGAPGAWDSSSGSADPGGCGTDGGGSGGCGA